MATPYHFTPRVPVPPHPTPLSATTYTPSSKAKRPPIHNPYDKFTQPEFDAWIGDITGALKRALGQLEVDEEHNLLKRTQEVSTGNLTTGYRPIDLDESEDEAVNDSFAEIKTRRALGKGKARDPREGPGLGGADRAKPIEIVSSDEEEEREVELAMGMEDDDSEDEDEEEEEEEEDDYSEQEGDYSWKRGQSSSQQISSPAKYRKYIQEGSEGSGSEEASEEDEDEDPATRKSRLTEIIDIVSDDEDEMDDDRQDRGHQDDEEERGADELQDGSDGVYSEEEEQQVRLGTSHLKFHAARISTSRDSRHSHYADKEEAGDEAEMIEDDDEIEEIQRSEANPVRRSPALVDRCIETPEPRIYAEENYTDGSVHPSPGTPRNPHYLGDNDSYEIEGVIPDNTDNKLDGNALQIAEQDTSFPPLDEGQERPVDIPDPWVGPQTYAEDFYAGGDVRTHPGQEIDPSLLEYAMQDDIGIPPTFKMVAPDEQGHEEPIEDEAQLEDELEHDEEAVIQPPAQHTFAPTSRLARRTLPIPAGAEFISIDDLDEETGTEAQKPINLGPLEVVEVEFHELQYDDAAEQNVEPDQSLEVDEILQEDIAHTHQPIPPLDSTPPSEADISIATWPLSSSSGQQDGISMDQSLHANIEAVAVQTEEQAEVISALVDWNYPPAFPAGIPTSAPGRLAMPSEESSADVEGSDVQAPDIEIDSPGLAREETSPCPLSGKSLDEAPVENTTKTLVDHLVLSAPDIENSERQLTSQTLTVDPSLSHTSADNLINDARIDESFMADEVEQEHQIDVETSKSVTQLVDEASANESVPTQQSTEDIVDDKIESRDVDISMQETKILMSINGVPVSMVLNSHIAATNADDGISPSAEGIGERMDQQTQPSTSSVQIPAPVHHSHTYDYDQLPTPPDQSPPAQSLSVVNDGPSASLTPPSRRHKTEIEEVEDEDDVRPQPFSVDSVELELQVDIKPAGEPGYTVVEPDDEYVDEDADGEIEFEVKVIPLSSEFHTGDEFQSRHMEMQPPNTDYIVEEPLTDGRLTEEPEDRKSLGDVNVVPEESKAHRTSREIVANQDIPFSTDEEPVPVDSETSSQWEMKTQSQTSSNPGVEEPIGRSELPTHVTSDSVSSAVEHIVPIPVTANANVADPTSCPDTPSHPSVGSISAVLDVQPRAQRLALGDGLFTPAEESTTLTPASPPQNVHSPMLDELTHIFSGTPPIVSLTPVERLVPVSNADTDQAVGKIGVPQSVQLSPITAEATHISGAHSSDNVHDTTSRDGLISTPTSPPLRDPSVSMHVALTRKPTDPILVSDPYPYSLSTPGVVSLMDEDTEQDNSMSSNSTLEKDLEDKASSILDDTDELELQYPPEPDILAELNISEAAKVEDSSKIADRVPDDDADGDLDPEFVVAPLPQSSVEAQLVADLPKLIASDSAVAPRPLNGIKTNDVNSKAILPIEPAEGISSSDFPPTEISNQLEASTTPPNEIAETSTSVRTSKRKRDSLQHSQKKVAATIPENAARENNEKVFKVDSKGKAKATNQEIVEQGTSEATIHVKPRRKTQSAVSKNLSEAWASSRSGSATSRMLRPSSPSPSVASSVPSHQSVAVMALPSPTVDKPNLTPVQTFQPISLFHAHGMKRNNQNNQSIQARTRPAQPSRPSIQRVISLPQSDDLGSTVATSPTTAISPTAVTPPTVPTPPANVKAVLSPAVRHVPAIPSTSPVTRSHCRYRRISVPREEGGLRVCFLVPGCSLIDRELMSEEEIEDHGDATYEDSLRMIKDIESFDFNSSLIGILRQLVGLDILREQEVFYLPQPGEEVVRKTSPRKERSVIADSSSYAGSPGYSGSIRSPASMKAPTSVADSTSTFLSAFRRRLDSEKGSVSAFSDTETEPSDGELPDAKRARPSPPDEQGDAGTMGPPLKAQGTRQLRSRRSKQIDGTYQPEEVHASDDDVQSSKRRKKFSKRGVKRRRGSEIPTKGDGDERISKKVKRMQSPEIGKGGRPSLSDWNEYILWLFWYSQLSFGVVLLKNQDGTVFMLLNTLDQPASLTFNLTESPFIRVGRQYSDLWAHTDNGTAVKCTHSST